MKQKIKQLFLNDLVKISSWTGIATAVKIAAQFITSKILSVFVGPAGLAIVGQLYNVSSIIQSTSTGGITVGVTKYVAEHVNDKVELGRIINSALKITFICSLVCSALVMAGHQYIGEYIFKTQEYNSVVLILGLTLILFSFNTLFVAIINGLKLFRLYVIINICTSVVSLLITLILIKLWGLYGALLAFVLAPALLVFVSYGLIARQPWFNYRFFSTKLDNDILKKLGQFSLVAINNAVVGSVAQIVVRAIITKNISLSTAGIWDGMNRVSAAYLLLLTTSIQVYYLPTLSAIKEPKALWREIMRSEKIILPLVAAMFAVLFFCRGVIIDVLFVTSEFLLMKDIFALQLTGDLIKVASWVLSYTMYAKAMTKQLILTDNIFTLLYIGLVYFFLDQFGFDSIYYAYIINQSIFLLFIYFFLKRYILRQRYNG